MKRFQFLVCLAFLLLLAQTGITSAASESANATPDATTTALTTAAATATTTPERAGGSVFFETEPSGATIFVDTVRIGTSDTTYFSEKTGTRDVLIQKKGYEEYTGTVTVVQGRRIVFYAKLTPVPRNSIEEVTPVIPLATATTIRMSTIGIPTPWPTTTPKSPVDPAVVIGAAALGIGFFVIRRR
ncbi:MAG: PEGA domain-containing protein [Methanoregula sp.]|nr:PEGA domain-containing protein [Methanoregula sp.]